MSRCIIVGAGEVGVHIAERLSREHWDVVVIESNPHQIDRVATSIDVLVVEGHGSSPIILQEAGIHDSQLLVAVTNSDETNIVACMVANAYAPPECQKIARVRNPDYMNDSCLFRQGLGIDYSINPEREASLRVLSLLETPQATDVARFANGKVWVLGLKLPEGSPLFGKTLAEVGALYPDRRLLAAAIERDDTIIVPRGDNALQEGDKVFLVAKQDKLKPVLDYIGAEHRELKHVAIAGGGFLGEFLASQLEKKGVSVRLIEQSRAQCDYLAERLTKTLVLHGDPTDHDFLMSENINQMDAFVTTTEDEETNILSGLIAKRMGTRQVLALVNKLSYSPLAHHIGLDAAISPRQVAANKIIQFIRKGKVLQVDALGEEQAEVIEFIAEANSPILDTPLQDLNFPKDALIGAVVRQGDVFIPSGTSTIQTGDRVVVFALRSAISNVEKIKAPSK